MFFVSTPTLILPLQGGRDWRGGIITFHPLPLLGGGLGWGWNLYEPSELKD